MIIETFLRVNMSPNPTTIRVDKKLTFIRTRPHLLCFARKHQPPRTFGDVALARATKSPEVSPTRATTQPRDQRSTKRALRARRVARSRAKVRVLRDTTSSETMERSTESVVHYRDHHWTSRPAHRSACPTRCRGPLDEGTSR